MIPYISGYISWGFFLHYCRRSPGTIVLFLETNIKVLVFHDFIKVKDYSLTFGEKYNSILY